MTPRDPHPVQPDPPARPTPPRPRQTERSAHRLGDSRASGAIPVPADPPPGFERPTKTVRSPLTDCRKLVPKHRDDPALARGVPRCATCLAAVERCRMVAELPFRGVAIPTPKNARKPSLERGLHTTRRLALVCSTTVFRGPKRPESVLFLSS